MSQILIQEQKQKLKASQLLRQAASSGKYKWISGRLSDSANGRCAIGVIMSELGWDGNDDGFSDRLFYYAYAMTRTRYYALVSFSNRGHTFEESADWLEGFGL